MSKINNCFKSKQLFILSLFFWSSITTVLGQTQMNSASIIDATHQQLMKHKTISYTVEHAHKTYWDSDTTTKGNFPVHIIKDTSDSMLGGYFFIEELERLTEMKNGEVSYKPKGMLLYDLESLFVSYTNSHFSILKAIDQGGIMHGNFAHFYFLQPEMILNYKEETTTISEVIHNEKPCWLLEVILKDGPKTRDISIQFWIDKSTYDIYKVVNQFQFNNYDGFQYDELNFSKITYDNITKEELFEKRADFKNQKMRADYYRYKPQDLQLITDNSTLPSFEGWNFSENRTIHSSEYLGSPLVLCVWSPMMFQNDETFELLNSLQKKFTAQGVTVLGLAVPSNPNIDYLRQRVEDEGFDIINSQRTTEYYKGVIESILVTKSLDFTNLLIDKSVSQVLGAIGYPEIFIIDNEGVIQKHFIGFSPKYEVEIEEALKAMK
jgi:peroxiredoxin